MNTRERFNAALHYGKPDRVPYFEEGIRKEVVRAWRRQGLPHCCEVTRLFPSDKWERVHPDLEPHPEFVKWPETIAQAQTLRDRLDPADPGRLPKRWSGKIRKWKRRDHPLLLYVHRGLFLTLGVEDWSRFREVMTLLGDRPAMAKRMMDIQAEFATELLEKVLQEVDIDAAVFSEPIGGNDRPLISPRMYEDIVLSSYAPLLQLLKRHQVDTIVFQTFANARILIPGILKWGFNCLWACEVNIDVMDYPSLRKEFGRELRLIGGIDLDALRQGKEAIKREIEEKVPALLADGGYIPLADGRVRTDVPFENYSYYRQLLQKVIAQHAAG